MYLELSDLLSQYEEFPIRCYGHAKLLEALSGAVLIQNVDTFVWFSEYAKLEDPAFAAFDIMDQRWDPLAASLPVLKYLALFESCLTQDLDKMAIQERIARFDALTGKSYLDLYRDDQAYCRKFSLLVEAGVIDLWDAFQTSVDAEGIICALEMMQHIRPYLRGIKTVQAFQFYQKFLPQYGFAGYREYLASEYGEFTEGLVRSEGYTGSERVTSISLERDYLKGDAAGTTTILRWLEEYIFRYKPSVYLSFVCQILLSEHTAASLPQEKQRTLFDLIITWPALAYRDLVALKKKYWTAEEWAAEEAAQVATALEVRQKEEEAQVLRIRNLYERKQDGTIRSLFKFLKTPVDPRLENAIKYDIVLEQLPQLLHEKNYRLESQDTICFLQVCLHLAELKYMSFAEIQSYILKIKEVSVYDTGADAEHPPVQ